MSNVYGSLDQMDWYTAVLFRKSIRWMKETDQTKYALAISKETEAYKTVFNKLTQEVANDKFSVSISKVA